MLQILEKKGCEGYERLVSAAGDAQLHITEAADKGRTDGYIAYAYLPGDGDKPAETVVYGLDSGGDIMLCDGLVRSVMLKSVLKGIEQMRFSLPEDGSEGCMAELKKLRFIAGDSNICTELSSYMNGCSDCKANK
ncbi:MAG: hypothetical protein IJ874_08510 [Ruminococcus sp.]|nr:hypothetical protein [Ruminococcus sp.]